MRKIFVHGVFMLLLFPAFSQDSLNTTTLREIVVSATRTGQPVIEIPRSVTVIHETEIRNSVYQSLGDLLNAQSGLFVMGAGQTPGTNQTIFMRGASSNQVAVLIDGIRITDPSSPNAAIDLSEISLTNVERIEVIRGSHSTMFGGAAIGGVINLITKKDGVVGFQGDASWQGGTFGKSTWLSTENVNLSYGLDNGLYFRGSLFRQDVGGLDATAHSETNPSFTADRDDFRKTDGSLRAGFKNVKWDASVAFKSTSQYTEVDNGAFADDDNYYLRFDRQMFHYNVAYSIRPAIRLTALGSLSDSERFYENDSSKVGNDTWDKAYSTGAYTGKIQTHEVQFNYDQDDFQGVLGVGVYREKMFFDNYFFFNDPAFPFEVSTNYDTIDARASTRYAFAQASYELGSLRLSAGGRLSHHTMAGDFVTFEINPSFTTGDFLLFGSVSSAFNTPSLYQLYDPTRNFSAHTTRGNENLEPERSLSLEAGVKKEFSSGSFITLSAYHTRVQQSIEYIYFWDGARPLEALSYMDDRGDTYLNVGEQRARGLELDAYFRISERLSLKGNVSMLQTRVEVDPDDVNPAYTGGHHVQLYNLGTFLDRSVSQEQMVRRPDLTSFARLRYAPVGSVALETSYRYTGRRFDSGFDGTLGPYGGLGRIAVDAYHLVDIGLNWHTSETLTFAGRVDNIFNEAYREMAGFQTRGRSFYLKVTARW